MQYIPNAMSSFDDWMANFSTNLTADPTVYGLVAGDAVVVAAAFVVWHAAYVAALDPSTRTPAAIAAKDDARTALTALVRPYAIAIRNNAGVSNELKTTIGVTVPDLDRTEIPAPLTFPVLTLTNDAPGVLKVDWKDSAAIVGKAKPFGAIQAEVYVVASNTIVSDPTIIPFEGLHTKSPFFITLPEGDVGKQAYVVARWVTRRGLTGPFGAVQSLTVAG